MNSESRKRTYSYATRDQVHILKECYAKGLRSKDSPLAEEAVQKSGLPIDKVMSWVYSKKCREKGGRKTTVKARLTPPTTYHIALKEMNSNMGGNVNRAERFAKQGEEWKRLKENPTEYQRLQEQAERARERFLSGVKTRTPAENLLLRKKLMRKASALSDEFEQNGMELLLCVVDKSNTEVDSAGSRKGREFLEKNSAIKNSFYVHCTGRWDVKLPETIKSLGAKVTAMWNDKYSKALKKPGQRVPYSQLEQDSSLIKVHGSEVGIKKACLYRKGELKYLLENQDSIYLTVFYINNSPPVEVAMGAGLAANNETETQAAIAQSNVELELGHSAVIASEADAERQARTQSGKAMETTGSVIASTRSRRPERPRRSRKATSRLR